MSSYILVKIDNGGYIRCADEPSRVVHKETRQLDKKESLRCFARLDMIKSVHDPSAESDEAILMLDDAGGGENIWIGEEQSEKLTDRLKIWSGCYGGWKVRSLNT